MAKSQITHYSLPNLFLLRKPPLFLLFLLHPLFAPEQVSQDPHPPVITFTKMCGRQRTKADTKSKRNKTGTEQASIKLLSSIPSGFVPATTCFFFP